MSDIRLLKGACLLSSGILAVVGLALGQPPAWLLKGEVVVCCVGAALYGFTGLLPRAGWLIRLRPIRGVLLVAMGSVALLVPAQFLVSAALLGCGFRQLWASACGSADSPPGTTIVEVHPGNMPARG